MKKYLLILMIFIILWSGQFLLVNLHNEKEMSNYIERLDTSFQYLVNAKTRNELSNALSFYQFSYFNTPVLWSFETKDIDGNVNGLRLFAKKVDNKFVQKDMISQSGFPTPKDVIILIQKELGETFSKSLFKTI